MKNIQAMRKRVRTALPPGLVTKAKEILQTGAPATAGRCSFDEIGISLGIDQSSNGHDYLGKYETHLRRFKSVGCDIVIFSNNDPVATGTAFASFVPAAKVHLVWLGKKEIRETDLVHNLVIKKFGDNGDIHSYLATLSNIQIVIDDGLNTKSSKLECFKEFFFHLGDNGIYVAEDLHASHMPKRNDVDGPDVHRYLTNLISHKALTKSQLAKFSDESLALARSIDHITTYGDIAFVSKTGCHAYKLADRAANTILSARLGDSWGDVISTRPQGVHSARCSLRTNRPQLRNFFRENIKYAELSARAYDSVVCAPGQIVYRDEFILPDTYRLSFRGNLNHRRLKQANSRFVAMTNEMRCPDTYLDGEYFYLDREWPAYGHVPTEVISRLWAWDEAKRKYPALKVLVSAPDTADVLPPWEEDLIEAYGIPKSDITVLTAPARVRKLIAATPMFEISDYIHPDIGAIWSRVRDGLIDREYQSSERVFLSRRPGALRQCRNADELERVFADHGFAIIRPEMLPLGRQIALISNAKVIAGYAGSALLNAVFSESPKSMVVIGSDSFRNANEYLINGMIGGSFTYVLCRAEIQQPEKGWSQQAYHSPFSFDFDADGDFLSQTFSSLGC